MKRRTCETQGGYGCAHQATTIVTVAAMMILRTTAMLGVPQVKTHAALVYGGL